MNPTMWTQASASIWACTCFVFSLTATASETIDWPAYGATAGGTHYSAAAQLTPANVAGLEVAWQHRSGDFREAGMGKDGFYTQSSLQVTPILVEDRLYYCSGFNRVFALDPATGEELWVYDPGVDMEQERILPNCQG